MRANTHALGPNPPLPVAPAGLWLRLHPALRHLSLPHGVHPTVPKLVQDRHQHGVLRPQRETGQITLKLSRTQKHEG